MEGGPTTQMRLRVSPGARRSGLVGRHGEAWKVRVAASPEAGRANDELLALLAGVLELPSARLELVSGRASRDKVVRVSGLADHQIEERLEAASAGVSA